jgi:hypothetical protein
VNRENLKVGLLGAILVVQGIALVAQLGATPMPSSGVTATKVMDVRIVDVSIQDPTSITGSSGQIPVRLLESITCKTETVGYLPSTSQLVCK